MNPYSLNPSAYQRSYTPPAQLTQQEREDLAREEEVADLERQFLLAASVGDVHADADFAPSVYDHTRSTMDRTVMRPATVGEVLHDGFDYARGPTIEGDVMALLCRAAKGEDVKGDAAAMLQRAAAKWADMQAGA